MTCLVIAILECSTLFGSATLVSAVMPEEPAPPVYFKVCGPTNPAPCATRPRILKSPNPSYSSEARKKKVQGTVALWLIVDSKGVPDKVRVVRPIGYGLDEKAIEAVRKWRFQPGTMDEQPVAVEINVEVTFRVY